MMPQNIKTKIFLDGGDPKETREIKSLLGFLDGQTTNPTLIAKNPDAKARLEKGEKFSTDEIYNFYKKVVREISALIPEGSVSIEVYADKKTSAEEMLKQGREMFLWIPNAHIKFPTTHAGLTAAERATKEGIRVNMTLCFTQEQAAAVYAATRGATKGQVFVSPFVGRLDDKGENGMDVIKNILRMYEKGDGHVEVLSASVRSLDHFLYALQLGSDIITAPYKALKEWGENGAHMPGKEFTYMPALSAILYSEIDLSKNWKEYNISHELTDIGLQRFADDWNALIR